jgi:8-hydroxy-5-deazaflavin:NADPH oxidoreductase
VRVHVLGTGAVGRRLAGALSSVGHDVTVGTRDPAATRARATGDEVLAGWLDDHGDLPLVAFAQLPTGADLVVNAVAGLASLEAIAAVPATVLEGTVLLDVANALDFSGGFPPALAIEGDDSLGEAVQRAAPAARVVKGLNTVANEVMVDPGGLDGRHELPIAGDDADAKALVVAVLADLGWPREAVIDLGPLRAARATERWLPLWLAFMQHLGTTRFNLHLATGPPAGPAGSSPTAGTS